MLLIDQINAVIAEHHLLKHPFYQAWSKGELSQETLQIYAAQYYHQVQSFPRFISRVHSECPEIAARKVLLENLVDEEIHGTDHPALWMQFAEGLGVSSDQVNATQAFLETQAMVDKYYELAAKDWRTGLVALYAYESQVPAVSASKMEGLKEFYDITDKKTVAFFDVHQAYDVKHAEQVADLITRYGDADLLRAAKEASV
ncbi:MAG: Tena/thi-4 family, partial [uncultured bacterium]